VPARRRVYHRYSVYIGLYSSEDVKRAVEGRSEDFSDPSRFTTQDFYTGSSQAQAERNFAQAAIAATQNPLCYVVVMKRDQEILARLSPLHVH
jgi:hypothetical protein